MKIRNDNPHISYDNSLALAGDDNAPLHFRHLEIRGRHVIADGEYLHELQGDFPENDGGTYDAALV